MTGRRCGRGGGGRGDEGRGRDQVTANKDNLRSYLKSSNQQQHLLIPLIAIFESLLSIFDLSVIPREGNLSYIIIIVVLHIYVPFIHKQYIFSNDCQRGEFS